MITSPESRIYNVKRENKRRFYQLPMVFFTHPEYQKMKPSSKILYAILTQRLDLSRKNKWVDRQGNIYIKFTRENLADAMNVSRVTIIDAIKQLVEYGLVIDVRQENKNAPNIIYLCEPEEELLNLDDFDGGNDPLDEDEIRSKESLPRSGEIYPARSKESLPQSSRNFTTVVKNLYPSYKDQLDLTELDLKDQKSGETAETAAHGTGRNSFVPSRQPERGIYKVKQAHETGDWVDVNFTDVTYYFVHRHNQIMPQTLQLSRQVGYDVKVLRENFFIANDIPLEQTVEAIDALIEKYKKCSLVKREYAGCISFNTFRLPHLMNALVPGVRTTLQRIFNPQSEQDDTDYSEAF